MADALTTVQVALRIRPLVENEIVRGCQNIIDAVPNEPQIIVKGTDKAFTYNYVFDSDTSQHEFYETAIKDMIGSLFKGYNVTILAYGQTGSGKTHSMGTCYTGQQDMGVIPRAVQDIFSKIEKTPDTDFQINVSFMELYQESLYDLLADRPREQCTVDIREAGRGIIIPGLTERHVMSTEDTINCLIQGSQGRVTGATAMNAHSSRSHAIFTISVQQQKKGDENSAMSAKFHLVDLAGSERPKKTKATGDRFKEGVNINKGLLALGNVISALGEDSQKGTGFIGYRDSKLTRLLQDSLGGNSYTLMIACISPADYNLDETLSTLRYADRARKIKNKPIINQDPKAAEIVRLNQKVRELQMQLLERGGRVSICPAESLQLQQENKELKLKNRLLSEKLEKTLLDYTSLCEKNIIVEMANEKFKNQIIDLESEFLQTLDKAELNNEQIDKFEQVKKKIEDIKILRRTAETNLLDHELTISQNSNDDKLSEDEHHTFDKRQETHTMQQFELNSQLKKLSEELVVKERLAAQLMENADSLKHYTEDLDIKRRVESLEKERNELLAALKTKNSETTKKKISELEEKIEMLRKKNIEKDRLLKLKERDDSKINQLRNEIATIKQAKVRLIRQMRSEAEKFKAWKKEQDREMSKLKDKDRKLQSQLVRMENMHAKQQTVLRRKVEEAAAVNKQLKDALMVQKAAQDRRAMNQSGKMERVQNWISQEIQVILSTVRAEHTLEHLIEDRAVLAQQKETLDVNSEKAKELDEELDLRSAQIADLKQKIADSYQENKSKSRFDGIQTMIEAKCALKQLFNTISDIKRKELILKTKTEDMEIEHKEKMEELNKQLQDINKQLVVVELKYEKQLDEITQQYEEKVSVLLGELSGKPIEKTHSPSPPPPQLPSINNTFVVDKENVTPVKNEKSKETKWKKSRQVEIYEETLEALESSGDFDPDDVNLDPDWQKTPFFKRIQKLKRQTMYDADTTAAVKRTSDGQTKCNCKTSCSTRQCSCRKFTVSCSANCKCKPENCLNKESITSEDSQSDAEQTSKKPRALFENNDANDTFVMS